MYEVAGEPAGGEPGSVYLRTMEVFPTQDSPAITIFTSSGRGSSAPPGPGLSPAMAGAECRPGRAALGRGGRGPGASSAPRQPCPEPAL